MKQTPASAPGGKRVGPGRSRVPGANGASDDYSDIFVSSATIGGEIVKNYKIEVGKDYLPPKHANGFLYITTIKSAAANGEAAPNALLNAASTEEDANECDD
jgi:hypothetical protein